MRLNCKNQKNTTYLILDFSLSTPIEASQPISDLDLNTQSGELSHIFQLTILGKMVAGIIQSFPFILKFQQESLRRAKHIPTSSDSCCASKAAFQHSQQRQQLETLKCSYKHPLYSDIVPVAYFYK